MPNARELASLPSESWRAGTSACLSALYTAGRQEELPALLETARFKWWRYRRWGEKVLVALGRRSAALRYAEASRGLNQPDWQIAQVCEEIPLSFRLSDEAYARYAIEANQSTTNLATFQAITKKFPQKEAADILQDLVRSQPGAEGKWFTAAKDAGLFDAAIDLAQRSPTAPRALTRAARDYATHRPDFATAAGMAALHWIASGYGYDIAGADVVDAYQAVLRAARCAGVEDQQV